MFTTNKLLVYQAVVIEKTFDAGFLPAGWLTSTFLPSAPAISLTQHSTAQQKANKIKASTYRVLNSQTSIFNDQIINQPISTALYPSVPFMAHWSVPSIVSSNCDQRLFSPAIYHR